MEICGANLGSRPKAGIPLLRWEPRKQRSGAAQLLVSRGDSNSLRCWRAVELMSLGTEQITEQQWTKGRWFYLTGFLWACYLNFCQCLVRLRGLTRSKSRGQVHGKACPASRPEFPFCLSEAAKPPVSNCPDWPERRREWPRILCLVRICL